MEGFIDELTIKIYFIFNLPGARAQSEKYQIETDGLCLLLLKVILR